MDGAEEPAEEGKRHRPVTRNTFRARTVAFLREPANRGIFGVFILKASMVALNFLLITLAARSLGKADFGIYSILFSGVGLFGIVATFGQQIFVLRSWNEYSADNDPAMLKGALWFTLLMLAAGCLAVAVGFDVVVSRRYGIALAWAATLYLVSFAVVQTTNHIVRTAIGVFAGDGIASFVIFLPACGYLGIRLLRGEPADIVTLFHVMTAGATAGLIFQTGLMALRIKRDFLGFSAVRPRRDLRVWLTRSLKLWMSATLEASNQYLDVLLIGYLMSPAIAGAYFITTRIANVFAAASDSVNMLSTKYMPDYYYRGETEKLDRLLDSVASVTLAAIVGGSAVILFGGYWILELIEPNASTYYPWLVLLCVGTVATAATGPSAPLLMITGYEGRYLAIIAGSVGLRALGFFLLIPPFGIAGAVTATTISFVVMAFFLRHSTKLLAGLDASILRLAGKLAGRSTP